MQATAIISPKISVQYIVEYSDDRCSTAPDPAQATTKVPAGSVALIVMQEAANDDSQLRFTATYFGSDLGYYIDAINGTSTDSENRCYWLIYVRYPNGTEFLSPLGVSSYVLPGTGYSLIWRYTRTYDTTYVPDAETQSLTTAFEVHVHVAIIIIDIFTDPGHHTRVTTYFYAYIYNVYIYTVKTRVSRNSPIRSLWNALEGETVNRCLINTSVEYLYFFIPQRCLVNSNTLKQISSSSQKLQETSTIIYSSTIHFSKLE